MPSALLGPDSCIQIRDQLDCIVGVRDASFSVGRGEIFCIMGLSGSGKRLSSAIS